MTLRSHATAACRPAGRGAARIRARRPLQLFHYGGVEDIPTLAAAYAVAIARNHAFFDGNKRAAFAALGLFLLANGLRLTAPPAEATRVMIAVAASELDEEAFAAWVGRNVRPRGVSGPRPLFPSLRRVPMILSDDASLARSLLTPRAVRERAHRMLAIALENGLDDLSVDLDRLDAVADYVIETTRAAYPDLAVPPHSRWRHFSAGDFDRWGMIADARGWTDAREAARAAADLAIVSVLLDAGAGPAWRFEEAVTGETFARSEGLAVASFAMIASGVLSADPGDPIRVDAEALENLSEDELASAFQVSADNPLAGLEGRVELMRNLGTVVDEAPEVFALADRPRPGGIVDALVAKADDGRLPAAAILEAVLAALGAIWPSRIELADVPLGDTWRHPALVTGDATTGLVPLHKLSQWLSYS